MHEGMSTRAYSHTHSHTNTHSHTHTHTWGFPCVFHNIMTGSILGRAGWRCTWLTALFECCPPNPALRVCGDPGSSGFIGDISFTVSAHFVSVLHFGNSHRKSSGYSLWLYLLWNLWWMIFDVTAVSPWRLRRCLAFFSSEVFFKLRSVHLF